MFKLMWRQRRRSLFSGFFFSLYLALTYGAEFYGLMMAAQDHGADPLFVSVAVSLAVICFVIAGLIVALILSPIILFLPALRFNAETVSLTLFLWGLVLYFVPAAIREDFPLISFGVLILVAFALPQILYGHVLDRFPLRLLNDSTRSFVSPKSAEQLWEQMVPGAGPVAAHWESALRSIEVQGDDPGSLRLVYALGGGCFLNRNIRFQSRTAPHHCIYRSMGDVTNANQNTNAGTVEITISSISGGRHRVTVTESPDAMLPRIAFADWMDDLNGDSMDHISAKHHTRRDWSITGRVLRRIEKLA